MAALESLSLLFQLVRNLEGLRRDMRANAQSYKKNLAAGRLPAQVAEVMAQDAVAYNKRLGWLDRFQVAGAPRTVMLEGLNRVGITGSQALDIIGELQPSITAQLATAQSTPDAVAIIATADALLAAIPPHESLWPDQGTLAEPS